jgi:hypothetical protein
LSHRSRSAFALAATCLLAATLFTRPAAAQDRYTLGLGLLGGVGGSLDAEPGDGLSNVGYQLNLALVTESRTQLGLRVGQMALDDSERFGNLLEAELTYATIGGEYRISRNFYESGIYLGLGGYQLDGDRFSDGGDGSETALGIVLGLTGEFEMTKRLGLLVEISGHWANLEEAQLFAMGHVGVVVHF